MSIHKLTAGSGYDYLTRQVAALDATEKGHIGLASYYSERGEVPGVWLGSGMSGIDGMSAGDVVSAEQMRALFGSGLHPLGAQRQAELQGPGLTEADYQAVMRLGAPFKIYDHDVSDFRVEVAKRIAAINEAAGLPGDWPVPATDRARVRTQVARELFRAEHGREPVDARELASTIAKASRPKTRAVAGYDLTFSPVKSVSTLWAVADPAVAAAIERAHRAAVLDALTFLETHALFTRTGTNGIRQVDVKGMVASAFTHRDSRAGDPDLHTHVAVANKVQTLDGRWLSIDGRVLFKATVAASETYNTALEHHLQDNLGVRFAERPNADPRLRPVREVVGVDPELNARWSVRRAVIEIRRGDLAADFQARHGRPPTPVEALQLAQQATLETRDAKHEPRSLAEQRATWLVEAVEVLGSDGGVQAMVRAALSPVGREGPAVDCEWVSQTAERVLAAMEARRSTWQAWHVRAEAHRQVRTGKVPTTRVEALVDLLVADVLQGRSVSLARPSDGVDEPASLRRSDGSSVYTVAGADLFTSARVLAAEQRLVSTAGRVDGYIVDASAVDLALLEATANGTTLNAGQAALVRQMATSGARLQLAIAPAGAGKTTAMQALTAAWTGGGGTVIGLAPSAAAAAQLREHIDAGSSGSTVATDTLAKLTWSIEHADLPGWAAAVGRSTLVVIDEAGMADTLSLDTVVAFVTGRGGSVRLVGDDQQLAAIGAGGVLRDIQATHGAVRLTELLRFDDPAEGAASLALRDGRTEALGFYLDHHRVHVGELSTVTEDVFSAWQADRSSGLDSIMLAPTRDLVAELNQRARAHRLTNNGAVDAPAAAGSMVVLADGNSASAGELVITRTNDRRLRTSSTDWVKNGDRWTVLAVNEQAGLHVRHTRTGRNVCLPAGYVAASTELGYATTVHTAQGVSVDTMHGLASGEESRQQLYTMMTRGRVGNHVYLQVVGDGDPHSLVKPETVIPSTPTDLLEHILARDDTPRSATTLQRDQHDPAIRLGEATQRYLDALYGAAEDTAGPHLVGALDRSADQLIPALSTDPAWPTLRAHLLLRAADGAEPVTELQVAARARELGSAGDRAAVLDWRLDDSGLRNAGGGPLPWIPDIPPRLRSHQQWGAYLTSRSQLVTDLAEQVRTQARDAAPPAWAHQGGRRTAAGVVEDVAVWRAAMQVEPQDRRPTGPVQMGAGARTWQQHLEQAIAGGQPPAMQEWSPLIQAAAPGVHTDHFLPILTDRLAAISRAGLDARQHLQSAVDVGPLPDDHAAAALWWRIGRHLTPPLAAEIERDHSLTTAWTPRIAELIGPEQADRIQASQWWPPLVTALDHALQRGWRLEDLLGTPPTATSDLAPLRDDECQTLVWRISVLADPAPVDDLPEPLPDIPPADMRDGVQPFADQPVTFAADDIVDQSAPDTSAPGRVEEDRWVEPDLAVAAMIRDAAGPPEQSDADVTRMLDRALAWQESPVSRQRMLSVNEMTCKYFQDQFPQSWGRKYLAGRLGRDLTDHPHFRPGQAPAGWTNLISHLRRHGVSDEEMTAAGVATTATNGRLIDRFRDRVVFPIVHDGEVLGFVGRRHPQLKDTDRGGPKYLNTADTPLFHKGAQLFGVIEHHLTAGGHPVVVEGPMDAIAVTIASHGRYVGVSTLGTSMTDEQAAQLTRIGANPIVATDGDLAGQVAAERNFWILTPHGLDPTHAELPDGSDPADLLSRQGSAALTGALASARPLGDVLVDERLAHLPADHAATEAVRILAARPTAYWASGSDNLSARLPVPRSRIRHDLRTLVKKWNADPRLAARKPLRDIQEVKARLQAAAQTPPTQRWSPLADQLDPRLRSQGDWPALADVLQAAHDQGHDVADLTRGMVVESPLNQLPAQDLRYRLVAQLHGTIDNHEPSRHRPGPPSKSTPSGTAAGQQQPVNKASHAGLRR